jgi:hypothetical protein
MKKGSAGRQDKNRSARRRGRARAAVQPLRKARQHTRVAAAACARRTRAHLHARAAPRCAGLVTRLERVTPPPPQR